MKRIIKISTHLICGILAVSIFVSQKLYAQCETQSKSLDLLQKEFETEVKKLEVEGNLLTANIEKENHEPELPGHKVRFTVKFNKKDLSFDLVDVTMKNKEMKFDIPSTTMKRKTISIPGTTIRWKTKKIGFFKTKIPQVVVYNQKKYFDLPEFKMNTTSIITKIPEFKKKTLGFSMHIPEFTLVSPIPNEGSIPNQEKFEEYKNQAEDLAATAQSLDSIQKEKILIATDDMFNCIESNLKIELTKLKSQKEQTLVEIDNGIKSLVDNKLDPANIKTDDGSTINLYTERENFVKSIDEALLNIENSITDLELKRTEAKSQLTTQD
ncbi:hypothetical protein HCX49_21800 [Sphingobacterium kitahiroshimense]|uniref:hypothetical protein n=1 Tax=Sphingobacterium sp. B16(2022) TaxID=2914044 RepID=UPI00143B9D02|nr:hypothetical protein [Sphingobacterium sp. B16(2022)]NJI75835.1 hypothetical protein [Sphingobacterium sp. B16(2022)]